MSRRNSSSFMASSLLLLLLFLPLSFLSLSATDSTAEIAGGAWTDAQQLLSFKAKLQNPQILQSWEPNKNPCDFIFVSCQGSRVSAINLTSQHLHADFASVASYLLSLETLQRLSLKSTNLTGNLLSDAGSRCGKLLIELDLAGNGLSGDVSRISSFSSCSSLKSLNLSGNGLEFSGDGVGLSSGGKPPCLQVLDLSFNTISGSGVLPWIFSGGCSDLQHLDLAGNRLAGEIPAFGGGGKGLVHLNLSWNRLSGEIPPRFVADACGPGASILQLDLSFNNLSGTLPPDFSSCSSLESLNVSNNHLSGEFPAETLTSMSSLKKLVLSYNDLTGVLPESFSVTGNLELLDLSSNSILGSIPSELCKNPKNILKELHLQNNQFTGAIPPALGNCSQLISLDLCFNYLTGTIPSSLGSLSQLRDLILWLNQLDGEIPPQIGNIRTLEKLILDDNGLTGTIPATLSHCTKMNWLSLSSNRMSGEIPPWIGGLEYLAILKLGNNSFSGSIPPELGACPSLIWLDLNSNLLNGTIPPSLSKQSGKIAEGLVTGKRFVYLKNNASVNCHGAGNLLEFAGIRPEQLSRVPRRSCSNRIYSGLTRYGFKNNGSMLFLDLSYNLLEGSIPKEIGSMYYLYVLNLGHNCLSGSIPDDLGNLRSVSILDLSHNFLEGSIPSSFSCLSVSEIDLSNNRLSGTVPQSGNLFTFQPYSFMNNSGLCGIPLPPCGGDPKPNSVSFQYQKSHRRQASIVGSVAMALLFSLFCIFGLIVVAVESKKRRKKKDINSLDVYIDSRSHSGTANVSWKLTGTKDALSINLATFEKPLRKLTFGDLLEATNEFHSGSLIGSGGFGDVYKAQLKDGSIVAVKKLKYISGQGDREFTAEMETIGKIRHRNLVPLLGYCKVREERLLVYEYMKFGSLEDILHDRWKMGIKLNWAARRKIAIGAARGLAFLHHMCNPHIIHRDMKSSNVLLDNNLEARVSDFGMARLMSAVDTHLSVSTLAGTPGYVPPEYYQSFRCSTKGDVYSYGVVLLELLTGKKPTDSSDFGDNNLVGWVKQHAKLKISNVFDPELMKEDPSLEMELLQHLKVACDCLNDRQWTRPTMLQVLAKLKAIQSGTGDDSAISIESNHGVVEVVEVSLKEGPELSKE